MSIEKGDIMPLHKRRTYSGAVLEQEVYNVAANVKYLKRAEPKPPPLESEWERQRHNELASRRRFERIVNTNFDPQSFYATFTLDDAHLVDNFTDAEQIMNNYTRRLQYAFPDVVIVSVMGRGITTERIHFHAIIKNATAETIAAKWTAGAVKRVDPLREHNFYDGIDHGQDYTALARYLFSHYTPEQGGKRWKQTRNIEQPDKEKPQPVKRRYSIDRPPKPPKGYKLVESRKTEYGYLYFKYVRIVNETKPPVPKPPMKC